MTEIVSATQAGASWNIAAGSSLVLKTSYAGVSVAAVAWINGTWITSSERQSSSSR
jgi:hypothetical protein